MDDFIRRGQAISTVAEKPDMTEDEKLSIIRRLRAVPAADVVARPRWIPVKEQPPKEWESVLVCFKSQGGLAQAVSERMGNNWTGLGGLKALWWMPLLKPPMEDDNG